MPPTITVTGHGRVLVATDRVVFPAFVYHERCPRR